MLSRNPYVIGVPLTDNVGFFGRDDVFAFVREVLEAETQNVIVLYGQRRIGKTSVLHHCARSLEQQGKFFPVYYDLQGKERLSLAQVLENLAVTLARRVGIPSPGPIATHEATREFADVFLPRLFEHLGEARLVLLIDEFDVLGDELAAPGAASETLFPYLQELIANYAQIGFIFVVGRRIEELATHFQAIFKQAVYRRIGHLRTEESRALIVEPAQGAMSYTDDAIAEIDRLAAGHPYFTQLICFEAFNAAKAATENVVTADMIRYVVTRAIESGHGALNWFWEGLPRAERFILSAVAHVSDESGAASQDAMRRLLESQRIILSGLELKDAPERLVEWQMLRRIDPNGYQFVVELVRRWVLQEHPLSSARRDIDYVNKRAVRLYENAREAHSEGDLEYARDEYKRTLAANPNHSGAQLGIALVLAELGDYEQAIIEFERAYLIDEMSARDGLVRARVARAKQLQDADRLQEAEEEYDRASRLAPADPSPALGLAGIWEQRGRNALKRDTAAAREAFRRMLALTPADATARIATILIAHAESAAQLHNYKHAAAAYDLLVEFCGDYAEATSSVAAFALQWGAWLEQKLLLEDALQAYDWGRAAAPADERLSERHAALMRKVQERQTAAQTFRTALAAERAGDFEKAGAGWKKLIQLDLLHYEGVNIAAKLAAAIAATEQPQAEVEFAIIAAAESRAVDDASPTPDTSQPPAIDGEHVPIAESSQKEIQPPERRVGDVAHAGASAIEEPRWLRYGFIAAPLALLVAVVGFATWQPTPVRSLDLSMYGGLQAGDSAQMTLSPVYARNWGRKQYGGNLSPYMAIWSSSDTSVLKVSSSGMLYGVGPGGAYVSADLDGASGGRYVTVRPYDIPAMKANVATIRFFGSPAADVVPYGKRQYDTIFTPKETRWVWVEFDLVFRADDPARALSAAIRYAVYRPDSSVAYNGGHDVITERQWPGSISTVPLIRTDELDTYTFVLRHQDSIIGSSRFIVR